MTAASTRLRIARDLTLPVDAATETIAILGKRGSGKSTTATVIVEELLDAGQQCVIVDPTDVWWGLRSSANGKAAGYPVVVLGGLRGDLPLAPSAGAAVADFVLENPVSVVCSLRKFASKAEQRRFVTDLATRLYFRRGEDAHPRPLMLVLDEASLWVPQRVMGEDATMVGAIQQIIRQGRSSGFGAMLIDQRAASVNKDVLTQLELLVAHRITSPQDRKAVREWIEQNDAEERAPEFLGKLASLGVGKAWFWSPGWLDLFQPVAVRAARTFDSRRTPKAGERVVTPKETAAVDLEALRGRMQESLLQAEANDPKALKARIRKLEAEVADHVRARGATPAANPAAIARAVDEAVASARAGWTRDLAKLMRKDRDALANSIDQVKSLSDRMGTAVTDVVAAFLALDGDLTSDAVPSPAPARARPDARPPAAAAAPRIARVAAPARTTERSSGSRTVAERILDTIGALEQMGVRQPDKATVAALVGYHPNAKSYANALGTLRTGGHIEYPAGGRVALTDSGAALAENALPIASTEELHALWFERLGGVAELILTPLIEAFPDPVRAEDVAAAAGYHPNAKSFANAKGRLRTLGLITYPGSGLIAATEVLFPEGLRR